MNYTFRIFKTTLKNSKSILRNGKEKLSSPHCKQWQRRKPACNANHVQGRVTSQAPCQERDTTATSKRIPGFPRDTLWPKGEDLSSKALTGARFTSKTYLNYWHFCQHLGKDLFWLGNRNKQVMDGHLAALPFTSKDSNTFSGVRGERGTLPHSSAHTARSGQDGFWQNSDSLPKELCCKADMPVAHTFPSFVSHILVYLSPEKHNTFQNHYFFPQLFFVIEEKSEQSLLCQSITPSAHRVSSLHMDHNRGVKRRKIENRKAINQCYTPCNGTMIPYLESSSTNNKELETFTFFL